MPSTSKLEIRLLGGVQILPKHRADTDFQVGRGRNLLYYLLLHRDMRVSRDRIASDLCHGYGTTAQSRKNLRNALWALRSKLLGVAGLDWKRILIVHQDSIELRTTSELWIDVDAFEKGANFFRDLSRGELTERELRLARSTAILYRGRLLPGCYEPWCEHFRDRLHQEYLSLLRKLAHHYEGIGAYETAISYCDRILSEEPAHEGAYRELMQLYILLGDRTGALRQYYNCCRALEAEFGATPGLLTNNLARGIRNGTRP